MDTKSIFQGTIFSIQPQSRLTRSFDEASHTYLGYAITLEGELDNTNTTFSIGIGKAAHAKHQFKVNDVISGECVPVHVNVNEFLYQWYTFIVSFTQYKILTSSLLNITKSQSLKLSHLALYLITQNPGTGAAGAGSLQRKRTPKTGSQDI